MQIFRGLLAAEGLPGAVLHQDVDIAADGEDRAALEALDQAGAAGFARLRRVAEAALQALLRPEDTEGARRLIETRGGAGATLAARAGVAGVRVTGVRPVAG